MAELSIIFTRGIQGSGKTTWAKQFCIDNPEYVRVSRDDLRHMRGWYWIPDDEGMILKMEVFAIASALIHGKNVVVDAMNLDHSRDIEGKVKMVRDFIDQYYRDDVTGAPLYDLSGLRTRIQDFSDISLEECLRRNLIRENSLDPKIIKKTWEKYFAKTAVYNEDSNLPWCIIVDIDGTLAKPNGRGPYEWEKAGDDSLNLPINDIIASWRVTHIENCEVILCTGRDESFREITEKWLNKWLISYDKLLMRPKGDERKDTVVKKELFEQHIKGKYYVRYVLEDRDRMVDMWRKELGMTCLQVDYGDF